MAKSDRIYWTERECARLLQQVLALDEKNPGMSLMGLFREAQGILPAERRRNLPHQGAIKPEVWQTAERMLKHAREDIAVPAAPPILLETIFNEHRAELAGMFNPAELVELFGVSVILDCIDDGAVIGFAATLAFEKQRAHDTAVKNAIGELSSAVEALSRQVSEIPKLQMPRTYSAQASTVPNGQDETEAVPEAPGRLPVVSVFSLLPDQQHELSKRLQGQAVLRFIDKNQRQSEVPDSSEVVAVNLKFASHTQTDKIAKWHDKNPSARVIWHKGGLNHMAEKIKEQLKS